MDGWAELRDHRRLSIDFLMGAAAVGAAAIGNPFEGGVLIFLFSLSKALEHFAMGRTRTAVASLLDLRPKLATLADAQGRETGQIPVEQLEPGQAILVRPGERIAGDGVVRSGGSEVDQAVITGESVLVRKAPADRVFGARHGILFKGGAYLEAWSPWQILQFQLDVFADQDRGRIEHLLFRLCMLLQVFSKFACRRLVLLLRGLCQSIERDDNSTVFLDHRREFSLQFISQLQDFCRVRRKPACRKRFEEAQGRHRKLFFLDEMRMQDLRHGLCRFAGLAAGLRGSDELLVKLFVFGL